MTENDPCALEGTGELLDLSEISANARKRTIYEDSGRKRKQLYDCNPFEPLSFINV